MRITVDESLSIDFDSWTLEQAGKVIEEIKGRHKERGDSVARGVLTLLLLGQIERNHPGTMDRLISDSKKAADILKGPQPETK